MIVLKRLIDIIYPPRCQICQAFLNSNDPFCPTCIEGFTKITSPKCLICGRPFQSESEEDHACEGCLRKRPVFDRAGAPYLYHGSAMTAVHQFKYAKKDHMAKPLGKLLADYAVLRLRGLGECLMVPVPLHPKKLRERGFNQSLLLAKHVSKLLSLELDIFSLRRIRYTRPQTGLKSDQRRKNVSKAFEVLDRKAIDGKRIVLVDDVATTGNTLNECSRVLKRSGAKNVFCIVFARTMIT